MSLRIRLNSMIGSILKRTDPAYRRLWLRDEELPKLWESIRNLRADSPKTGSDSLVFAMHRIIIALLYYQLPKEDRKDAVENTINILPFMLAFLRQYYICGLESSVEAETRRKKAERDWCNGKNY